MMRTRKQDAFASGSGGGSGKYLESGAAVTPAGIEETKRMLSSKRDFERTEGLKRVIAVRLLQHEMLSQGSHLTKRPAPR